MLEGRSRTASAARWTASSVRPSSSRSFASSCEAIPKRGLSFTASSKAAAASVGLRFISWIAPMAYRARATRGATLAASRARASASSSLPSSRRNALFIR